ncbi:MAG: aminoacyl-tRNA hydrolase [Caldilineales bacterium]|nr:aminoacyl-tRNA hydrolase [Caldilineales bacterium]
MDSQTAAFLIIDNQLRIPLNEISFRFARSSGPGGQHVNRSETQVELLWDVAQSPSLSEDQRARILEALAGRIDSSGILHVTAGTRRSQSQNRQAALHRFERLLRQALRPRRKRIHTAIPAAQRQKRLENKRKRSELKKQRGSVSDSP